MATMEPSSLEGAPLAAASLPTVGAAPTEPVRPCGIDTDDVRALPAAEASPVAAPDGTSKPNATRKRGVANLEKDLVLLRELAAKKKHAISSMEGKAWLDSKQRATLEKHKTSLSRMAAEVKAKEVEAERQRDAVKRATDAAEALNTADAAAAEAAHMTEAGAVQGAVSRCRSGGGGVERVEQADVPGTRLPNSSIVAAMSLHPPHAMQTRSGVGRRAACAIAAAHALHLQRTRPMEQRLSRSRASAIDCSGAGSGEDQERRAWDSDVIPKFVAAVAALPSSHGGALQVTHHALTSADLPDLTIHTTPSFITLEPAALPLLYKSLASDPPPELTEGCVTRGHPRANGEAFPEWQQAAAGCVTMPHIDLDSRDVPINTYLAVTQGTELIIAWRQEELDEGVALADLKSDPPSFARVLDLPSLTIVRVGPGDLVYMPARTVHMVITESDKVHLGFHTYP